jgi:hypothetical protein
MWGFGRFRWFVGRKGFGNDFWRFTGFVRRWE